MTALLVQKTEPGMLLLQALQGCERVAYPVQASLVGSDQIQDVSVLWRYERKRFGGGKRKQAA